MSEQSLNVGHRQSLVLEERRIGVAHAMNRRDGAIDGSDIVLRTQFLEELQQGVVLDWLRRVALVGEEVASSWGMYRAKELGCVVGDGDFFDLIKLARLGDALFIVVDFARVKLQSGRRSLTGIHD